MKFLNCHNSKSFCPFWLIFGQEIDINIIFQLVQEEHINVNIFEFQLAKVEQRARAQHVTDKTSRVFQNIFWFLRHNTMVSTSLLSH